jgi:hypothetical protein
MKIDTKAQPFLNQLVEDALAIVAIEMLIQRDGLDPEKPWVKLSDIAKLIGPDGKPLSSRSIGTWLRKRLELDVIRAGGRGTFVLLLPADMAKLKKVRWHPAPGVTWHGDVRPQMLLAAGAWLDRYEREEVLKTTAKTTATAPTASTAMLRSPDPEAAQLVATDPNLSPDSSPYDDDDPEGYLDLDELAVKP